MHRFGSVSHFGTLFSMVHLRTPPCSSHFLWNEAREFLSLKKASYLKANSPLLLFYVYFVNQQIIFVAVAFLTGTESVDATDDYQLYTGARNGSSHLQLRRQATTFHHLPHARLYV